MYILLLMLAWSWCPGTLPLYGSWCPGTFDPLYGVLWPPSQLLCRRSYHVLRGGIVLIVACALCRPARCGYFVQWCQVLLAASQWHGSYSDIAVFHQQFPVFCRSCFVANVRKTFSTRHQQFGAWVVLPISCLEKQPSTVSSLSSVNIARLYIVYKVCCGDFEQTVLVLSAVIFVRQKTCRKNSINCHFVVFCCVTVRAHDVIRVRNSGYKRTQLYSTCVISATTFL